MDFYLPQHKICIEFDGRQHFFKCAKFDENGDTLSARKERDSIKDLFCVERKIKMLRIRYTQMSLISDILKPNCLCDFTTSLLHFRSLGVIN